MAIRRSTVARRGKGAATARPPSGPKLDRGRRSAYVRRAPVAVNTTITLRRPLLMKGEPGTGEIMFVVKVSNALITDYHR